MNNDQLDKILRDYNNQSRQGKFVSSDEFKSKFFAVVKHESQEKNLPWKKNLWLLGMITATAAVVLFIIFPLNTVKETPETAVGKKINKTLCAESHLMRQLKELFPEKGVCLSLINDELNTFDTSPQNRRNIMINYLLISKSDGRKLNLAIATSSNISSNLHARTVKGEIWVYQPDNRVLNVDTDLVFQLDNSTRIKIQTSNLLELNRGELVSEFKYRGRKYELLQSACRI